MNAIEFTTELNGASVLTVPKDVVAQLPKSGRARIIVLTEGDAEDTEWSLAAYEQFLRDDSSEDSVYESKP